MAAADPRSALTKGVKFNKFTSSKGTRRGPIRKAASAKKVAKSGKGGGG